MQYKNYKIFNYGKIMKKNILYAFSVSACCISLACASPHSQDDEDNTPAFTIAIEKTLHRKIEEQKNNHGYASVIRKDVEEWSRFLREQEALIAQASNLPRKDITINGVELTVADYSQVPYAFLEHTTALTVEKAQAWTEYVLALRENRTSKSRINFDICPLLSASVIDPLTGGYTANCCNAGTEMQVHLILAADPRSPITSGLGDIYSPARRSINAFLNNLETVRRDKTEKETRASMAAWMAQTSTFNPYDLLKKTTRDFNEVVIAGNTHTAMLPEGNPIGILGIGLSQYWLDQRTKADPESIRALRNLSETTGLPLLYYDPKSPEFFEGLLQGKRNNFEKLASSIGKDWEPLPDDQNLVTTKRYSPLCRILGIGLLLKENLLKMDEETRTKALSDFRKVYEEESSKLLRGMGTANAAGASSAEALSDADVIASMNSIARAYIGVHEAIIESLKAKVPQQDPGAGEVIQMLQNDIILPLKEKMALWRVDYFAKP